MNDDDKALGATDQMDWLDIFVRLRVYTEQPAITILCYLN